MGRDRALAILIAVTLHAAVVALALDYKARRREVAKEPLAVAVSRLRAFAVGSSAAGGSAPQSPRRRSHAHVPEAVEIAEREIIDQGHGVTMTIQGGGGEPDAGVPPATPHAGERWLRTEVWVPSGPSKSPRPSDYCTPKEPEMPEIAVERSITGRVEVSYTVDSDGVASDIALQNDAPLLLSRAVRSWLSGCLFDPATEGGRRVPARVKQAFVFKIR